VLGEALDREVLAQMGDHPAMQGLERPSRRRLRRERRAELRLPAGPLHEDDEAPGGLHRDGVTEVFFDQRKREIDARRHAR
jgi:hypothetical protein